MLTFLFYTYYMFSIHCLFNYNFISSSLGISDVLNSCDKLIINDCISLNLLASFKNSFGNLLNRYSLSLLSMSSFIPLNGFLIFIADIYNEIPQ